MNIKYGVRRLKLVGENKFDTVCKTLLIQPLERCERVKQVKNKY